MARSFRNIPRGATSYVWKYFVLTEKENQVKCTIMIIGDNGEEKVYLITFYFIYIHLTLLFDMNTKPLFTKQSDVTKALMPTQIS